MMERCEETIRNTSRNILCWLKCIKLTSPTQEPFMLVRMSSSAQGYRLVHKKLLAFVCRAYNGSTLRIRMNAGVESQL